MPPRRTPRIINFVHGGTTYQLPIDGEIQIRAVNDSPPFVPTTGAQSAKSRQYHNTLSIKKIRDDFGAQVDLEFENRGGVLDILSDSTMDTRWGPIWMAPKENNPAMPTDAGSSIVCGPTDDNARQDTVTRASHNPKPTVFFRGADNTGVFAWRTDVVGANDYDLDTLRWGGTSWVEESLHVEASIRETMAGYDMVEHKGSLYFFHSDRASVNAAAVVASSSNGDAFTNLTASPVAHARSGSRLISDGNTLYSFSQVATTTGGLQTIAVESTDDEGGSTWDVRTAGGNALSGVLRDVDLFFDRNGTERIVFLTENRFLWYDTTNYVENELLSLPFPGRALARFGDKLLIFMDGMRVWEYSATGAIRDISPGGVQGMPSGKDFGSDTEGQVCVHTSARGVYALWSGADGGGADLKPLCLNWSGEGWHFIWQKADTSVSNAARFVTIDPVSGDLLMAVQDAISVDSTFVQLTDIEVNPDTQATLDRQTAGLITTPRLDFGVPMVPTTVWDIFNHTNGLDANETITKEYRIDGSTGSYTTIGSSAVAADNTLTTLASGAGVNARDFQFKFTYATSAADDVAKTFDIDVGYAKLWPVRLMYSFNVRTDFNIPGGRSAQQIRLDITTIMGVQTKGTLNLGGDAASDSATVIPIPETTASEIIGNLSDPNGAKRASTWTLHMLEA